MFTVYLSLDFGSLYLINQFQREEVLNYISFLRVVTDFVDSFVVEGVSLSRGSI